MGMIVLLTGIAMALVVVPLVTWLLYFIPKRKGYIRSAKWLPILFLIFVAYNVADNIFPNEFFTRHEARKELARQAGIKLEDQFHILTVDKEAMIEYRLSFVIKITVADKQRAIQQIKANIDFTDTLRDLVSTATNSPPGTVPESAGYDRGDALVWEYYTGRVYKKICVFKNGDSLSFED